MRFVRLWLFKKHTKLTKYENKLHTYLNHNDYDGVICGHTHQPKIGKIKKLDYFNSGDWIDNCSYLIENDKGTISLDYWHKKIN